MWGEILQTWGGNGYERSSYGFPTSDEYDVPGGKAQDFQGGRIEWQANGYPEDHAEDPGTPNDWVSNDAASLGENVPAQTVYPSAPFGRMTQESSDSCGSPEEEAVTTEEALQRLEKLNEQMEPPQEQTDDSVACVERIAVNDGGRLARSLPEEPSASEETPESAPTAPGTTVSPPSVSEQTPDEGAESSTAPRQSEEAEPTDGTTFSNAPTSPELAPDQSLTPSSPAQTSDEARPGVLAAPIPELRSYCLGDGTPNNTWRGGAAYICKSQSVVLTLRDAQLEPLGTIIGNEKATIEPEWNYAAANVRYEFEVTGISAGVVGTQLNFSMYCRNVAGTCFGNPVSIGSALRGSKVNASWSVDSASLQRGDSREVGLSVTIDMFHPRGSGASSVDFRTLRCDYKGGNRAPMGCRIAGVTPVMDYTRVSGSLPEFVNHVRKSQQEANLPGAVNGTALHRTQDEALINAKRRKSCGEVTGPRPPNFSCDEYPFASAREGALDGGAARGGTFNDCRIQDLGLVNRSDSNEGVSFTVCLINARQNSRAGGYLSWFYAKSRIFEGDRFWVNVAR